MENKVKLSASKIKTLQSCSWLYYVNYVLRLPQKPNQGAARGLCAHTVLECLINPRHKHYIQQINNDHAIPPAIEKLINKQAKQHNCDSFENIELIKEMVLTALKNDFECQGSIKLQAEEKFDIDLGEVSINGFIDKQAEYPNGEIEITDYKTSKAKFNKEELEGNIQQLMYSLATYVKTGKIPKVKFLFLRFPKQPLQAPAPCTQRELKGFRLFLNEIGNLIKSFTEKTATNDLAAKDKTRFWLCGKEGVKEDGSPKFMCAFRKPFVYYAIISNGEVVKTAFTKEELDGKGEVKKLYYSGCPHFSKIVTTKKNQQNDPFDF